MPLTLSTDTVSINTKDQGSFTLPFEEQIAFLKQKLNLPTEKYDDIVKAAHDRAFIVAGAMKADLLNDLHNAVNATAAEGKTISWFQKEFDNIVAKNGWTGWTGEGSKAGRDWRTRIIYDTNLSTSYAAGRYAQLTDPDLLAARPYWKYVHSNSVLHPRPLHVSWHGKVLRYDDPWWQTHFCPNGWHCRCRIVAVRASEYKGDVAPNDGSYTKVINGVTHTTPNGIDVGFDYPMGANVNKTLTALVQEKLIHYPPAIAQALAADLNKVSG